MKKVLLASAAAMAAPVPAVAVPQRSAVPQPQRPNTVLEKMARPAADDDDGEASVDADQGDGEPDNLVPDRVVCKELGVSAMALWRWDHEAQYANLQFPVRIRIGRRNFRSRKELEAFKARLMKEAIARRAAEGRG